jgi:hypothetical protein
MKKLWTVLSTVLPLVVSAQQATIADVKASEMRYVRPIKDKGYWVITEGDKLKKGKREYRVVFYDHDLGVINDQTIPLSKNMIFIDGAYNGSDFFMLFAELVGLKVKLTMQTFDSGGEEIAQKSLDAKSFTNNVLITDIGAPQVYAGDGGFFVVLTEYKGLKYGYEVIKFDESLKTEWRKVMMPKKGAHGVVAAKEAHGQLALVVSKRDKLLTREAAGELVILSSNDGKQVLTYDLADSKYTRLALSVFVDDDGSLIVAGNYWDGTKIVGSPDGVFFTKVNAQGEKVLESMQHWDKDISKMLEDAADRGILTTKPYIMFQTVEKTAAGDYVAVGESFYNAVGSSIAKSVALKMLNSDNDPVIDVVVEDFIIFQFDGQSGDLEAVTAIDKFKTTYSVHLAYAGFAGALYLKYYGYFDYLYTQKNSDGLPVLVFTDKDKSSREKQGLEKEESKYFVGFANIADISKVEVTKRNFKRKIVDGVVESKPGHYLLYEYNKKEKALGLTVEALEE